MASKEENVEILAATRVGPAAADVHALLSEFSTIDEVTSDLDTMAREKEEDVAEFVSQVSVQKSLKPSRFGFGAPSGVNARSVGFCVPDHWEFVDFSDDIEAYETLAKMRRGKFAAYGKLRASLDIPVAIEAINKHIGDKLLTEAVAARRGIIPENAFVEIVAPPFIGVLVEECRDTIYFDWVVDSDVHFACRVNVSDKEYRWQILGVGMNALRQKLRESIVSGFGADITQHDVEIMGSFQGADDDQLSAIYFMSAAILRDFWVVEDRESAFRLGPPRYRKILGLGEKEKHLIYLPRCRYSRERVERAACDESGVWTVSPHDVRSHFRTLTEGHCASVRQRAVAALHKVEIPEGKTWVKGHCSGSRGEAKIYRSRSAVKTLMQVTDLTKPSNVLQGMDWYSFERLCEVLIENRGYEVVDKIGDCGIDVLAIDAKGRFLVVQAKHWSKPVGPGVVRDMVGALDAFERREGQRPSSIILSSSGFSESARHAAADANVECVKVEGAQ